MFSIVINEKGGAQRHQDFDEPEISIGRLEANALCLPKSNVSKHHARLHFKDDRYVIVDQQSTNGTYVNGRRISGPAVVRRGDKIYIGDFILTLQAPDAIGKSARPHFTGGTGANQRAPQADANPRHTPAATTERSAAPSEWPKHATPPARPRDPSTPGAAPTPANGLTTANGNSHRGARVSPPPLPPRPRSGPPPVERASEPGPLPPAHPTPLTPPAYPTSLTPPPFTRSVARSPAPDAAPSVAPDAAFGSFSARASRPATAPPTAAAAEATPPRRDSAAAPRPRQSPIPARSSSIPPLPPMGEPTHLGAVDSAQAAALSGLTSPAVLAPSVRLQTALSLLMERLAPHLDIQREEESAFPSELRPELDALIDQLADEGALAEDIDQALLRETAINEAVGLGPLERLLVNRQVREIVVDGPTRVLADMGGGLTPLTSFFSDDSAVLVIAGRLLHRAGQRLDRRQSVHEAQLPNGGALQLLLPPLSPRGPLLSVRCPSRAQRSADSYVTDGALSADMLALLRGSLQQRKNIVVLGSLGSGVSELLSLLASLVPEHERIVSVEDSPSTSLLNPQVLPLCRRALPSASLQDLLQRVDALRPDRLVIDDLRLEEASTALLAAAGSGGVLLGMHAPDPAVALSLLTHSAGLTVGDNPSALLAAALQLFVHVGPDSAGVRRVLSIQELQLGPSGVPELRKLFRHEAGGFVASFLGR